MNSLQESFILHNGIKIPCVGFGTYLSAAGGETERAVAEALKVGYRHIDTAAFYKNESDVGSAVKKSGIAREEIFVTTKCWNADRGYENAKAACEKSLLTLGLSYIDLYLIHWPANEKQFGERAEEINAETWRAFEELYAEGKIRSSGRKQLFAASPRNAEKDGEIHARRRSDRSAARVLAGRNARILPRSFHSRRGVEPFGTGRVARPSRDRNARREVRQKSRADHSAPYVAKGHPSPPQIGDACAHRRKRRPLRFYPFRRGLRRDRRSPRARGQKPRRNRFLKKSRFSLERRDFFNHNYDLISFLTHYVIKYNRYIFLNAIRVLSNFCFF